MSFYIKTAPLELAKAFSKLGAVNSDDGMLRILSWDNTLSGTQHTYANIFLYKADGQLNYINSDTLTQHQFDEFPCYYSQIYSLKTKSKTYYLATYSGVLDLNERMEGIQIFAIDGDKFNNKVRLIKNYEQFINNLRFQYIGNDDSDGLNYNPKLKEITIPVVNKLMHVTGDSIVFKFNGRYFERMKSKR